MHVRIKQIWLFLLPLLTIVAQWFSVSGVRISWLIYILIAMLVFLRRLEILQNISLVLFAGSIVFLPFVTFLLGIAKSFNVSLCISVFSGLLYVLYIYTMTEEEHKLFLKGLFFSCIVFVVLGLLEMWKGYYLFSTEPAFVERLNNHGIHYPIVAFANVNDLAQYLAFFFPLISYRIIQKSKILFGLCLVAVMYVVYHTQSRLALVMLIVIYPLAYLLRAIKFPTIRRWRKIVMVELMGGVAFLGVGNYLGLIVAIVDKIEKFSFKIDFIQLRMDIYIPLLRRALIAPLGGFGTAYVINDIPPHSLFLYVLCDYGWIPFLLFLIFLLRQFWGIWMNVRVNKDNMYHFFLLAQLCLFPIASIISSCNEQRKAIWVFLALCIHSSYKRGNHNCDSLKGVERNE